MKHTKYRIMEITDGHDSKLGKVWIIKANPVEVNPIFGAAFITSDIDEDTETFIVSYSDELVVDEIEEVAKKGELWEPDKDEWRTELAYDEKKKKKTLVHRWTLEEPRIFITEQKPLRQFLFEQNADVQIFQNIKTGNMMFICGKVKGLVSPAAAKHIVNLNRPIDIFTFELVTKNDLPPVPYITLSRPNI